MFKAVLSIWRLLGLLRHFVGGSTVFIVSYLPFCDMKATLELEDGVDLTLAAPEHWGCGHVTNVVAGGPVIS
jgi:hypothetical protein